MTAIDADIPCEGCGYNLRGLTPPGSCPECGRDLSESLAAHERRAQALKDRDLPPPDPRWARQVYEGACVGLVAFAFWLAGVLFPEPWMKLTARSYQLSDTPGRVALLAMACAWWVLAWYSAWKLTAQEPVKDPAVPPAARTAAPTAVPAAVSPAEPPPTRSAAAPPSPARPRLPSLWAGVARWLISSYFVLPFVWGVLSGRRGGRHAVLVVAVAVIPAGLLGGYALMGRVAELLRRAGRRSAAAAVAAILTILSPAAACLAIFVWAERPGINSLDLMLGLPAYPFGGRDMVRWLTDSAIEGREPVWVGAFLAALSFAALASAGLLLVLASRYRRLAAGRTPAPSGARPVPGA